MADVTQTLNLTKPLKSERYNVDVFNSNADIIDKLYANTIEELKQKTNYKLGDVVEVLGFHAKGDGSHHKRIAKAEDDGSGELGQNSIWWCVVQNSHGVNEKDINRIFSLENINLFVAKNGSDADGDGTQSKPFLTIQKAVDSLPFLITQDVTINVGAGTYTDVGGVDEWNRPVAISLTGKFVYPKNTYLQNQNKGGKLRIVGVDKTNTILDGSVNNIRVGVYGHNTKNVVIEKIGITGFRTGVVAHEGGDITCKNVSINGNEYGVIAESQSRVDINWSELSNNTVTFYAKNGQLQINDVELSGCLESHFLLEGTKYIYTVRVVCKTPDGKLCINSKGSGYWDMRDCDFEGGSNSVFLNGDINYLQMTNTHVYNFGNAVFFLTSGSASCTNSHFWANGFLLYSKNANSAINFKNCDSKDKTGADVPNTQSTPIRLSHNTRLVIEDSNLLPYRVSVINNVDDITLYGTTPPTTGFHFKGKVMFNTGVALGKNVGWQCTVAGEPGTWVELPSLVSSLTVLDTPYYTRKMEEEGIYVDYVAYRDELHEYEKAQSQVDEIMLLPILQEPEIPESVRTFAEKYKLI